MKGQFMANEQIPNNRIKERDAARYIGMSVPFLRLSRMNGAGPSFLKLGRAVRYDIRDLDSWLNSKRVECR
jgi:predicted DNA-binding transcriptional regulator AlpA